MNMISTGAFQTEMDASSRQPTLAEKFAAVWEKKNAKVARAGGVSLMALSLAACGSDDTATTTTATTTTATTTTDTTTTVTTATPVSKVFTTGIDVLTGTTAGDTFTSDNNTGSAADQVDGGDGSDTVKMYAHTTMADMTSIENLEIYDATSASIDLSTTDLTQVTSLTLDGHEAVAASIFTMKAGDTLSLIDGRDATGNTHDINIHSAATVTAATVNVTASGTSATADMELDFTGTGMKTVTINALGATKSWINIEAATANVALTTVNINATSALAITDIDDATTIDASGSTGAVTMSSAVNISTITGGSGADDVTYAHASTVAIQTTLDLGAGNDTVTFTASNGAADLVDSKVTLDGGAGEDTFEGLAAFIAALGDLSTANMAKKGISNFEVLQISDALDNADTYSVDKFGVNKVNIMADSAPDATLSGLTSGTTITTGKAVDVVGSTGDYATLTLSDKAGSGDVVNIVILNTAGAGALQFTAAEVETITVDASASDQANVVHLKTANATALTLTTGTGDMTVDMSDATNQANAGLMIDTVDASGSASTGGVIFTADASNLAGITFTGGAGGDNFTGGDLSDVATGGAGNDFFDMGAGGTNTLDLTAGGTDEVEFNSLTGHTTITGFTTGDVIDLQNAAFDGTEVVYTGALAAAVDFTTTNYLIYTQNASTNTLVTGSGELVADFTDTTDVAAYLEAALDMLSAETTAAILNDGTHSYIYMVDMDGANGTTNRVDAGDITLIATVSDHILVGADVTATA